MSDIPRILKEGSYGFGSSEEDKGLIYEMRSEVVSVATGEGCLIFPSPLEGGTVAIETKAPCQSRFRYCTYINLLRLKFD